MIGDNYLVSISDISGQTITEPVSIEQAIKWLDNPDSSYKRSEERRVGKECRARWSADH